MRNRRKPVRRHYKIQEVIKRRQILLVQVVKEERGNKGAALTTYLSLAGRYSVLMPNTARGGGISRKITNAQDRKRLKEVVQDLEVPQGMGVILRTAGESRTKAEIKRDYEYLMRLWENVRSLTLQSTAPALVYEEGSLIKRSVRDLYNKDIDEILVSGDDGYREAKDFMRMLMPSHAKVVQPYRDTTPIFVRSGIEAQLDRMLQPQVTLKSGGYIIINQTEALVAIDVNSGRSTKEHSIEETALHTNLEAAEEVARQLRLRDLAGLIVIDFIDMEENRNNRAVEKRLKDHLKNDRARIQVGRISHFGLMEMSRQRIRASVLESTMKPCPHCGGTGHVRSESSVALLVVRAIEEFLLKDARSHITVKTPAATALYVLNHKRSKLAELEARLRPDHHRRDGRFGRRAALRDPARRHRGKAARVAGGPAGSRLRGAGRARGRDRRGRGRGSGRTRRRSRRAAAAEQRRGRPARPQAAQAPPPPRRQGPRATERRVRLRAQREAHAVDAMRADERGRSRRARRGRRGRRRRAGRGRRATKPGQEAAARQARRQAQPQETATRWRGRRTDEAADTEPAEPASPAEIDCRERSSRRPKTRRSTAGAGTAPRNRRAPKAPGLQRRKEGGLRHECRAGEPARRGRGGERDAVPRHCVVAAGLEPTDAEADRVPNCAGRVGGRAATAGRPRRSPTKGRGRHAAGRRQTSASRCGRGPRQVAEEPSRRGAPEEGRLVAAAELFLSVFPSQLGRVSASCRRAWIRRGSLHAATAASARSGPSPAPCRHGCRHRKSA